jgi:spermidine/putrescine-binding protein
MRQVDRRSVLRGGGALTVAALSAPALAGCGSSTADTASGGLGGAINFMAGSDTTDMLHKVPTFESWLRQHKVVVRPQFVADDTTALQKLAAGGAQGVNLIDWINQFKTGWQAVDLFAPLDVGRIPNYKNVIQDFGGPSFAGTQKDAHGNVISLPTSWAVSGIVYDSAQMPAPTSYADLLDAKYKGRVAMLDDPGATMIIGSMILGYNAEKLTKAQFRDVVSLMTRFVRVCRALPQGGADLATLMSTGEVIACPVDASFLPKMVEQGKRSFRATIALKEGGFSYGVLMSSLKHAPNTETVYGFMNEFFTPEVGRAIAETSTAIPGIVGATKWLPEWYRASIPVDDLPKLFHDNPSVNFPPTRPIDADHVGLSEFLTGWQQAKVGAKS